MSRFRERFIIHIFLILFIFFTVVHTEIVKENLLRFKVWKAVDEDDGLRMNQCETTSIKNYEQNNASSRKHTDLHHNSPNKLK